MPNWIQPHTTPTMCFAAVDGTVVTKGDMMSNAVTEADVAVVRGVEDVMLGGPSHLAHASIDSRMATANTPALNAILPTKHTTLVLHFQTCKESALQTANDGVGQQIKN